MQSSTGEEESMDEIECTRREFIGLAGRGVEGSDDTVVTQRESEATESQNNSINKLVQLLTKI